VNVESAFAEYQKTVNADDDQVREARRRRDLFKSAFLSEPDVAEVVASGSLRRGTQHDPIHDVDTILVYNAHAHPTWGTAGESAAEALTHVGSRTNALLGATSGTHAREVRLASPRDHAVKCFLDDPDVEKPFTVDAMPALRDGGRLLIPEARSRTWIEADPEHLIGLTATAHATWDSFAPLVRVLKCWRHGVPTKVKSLVMEVLALEHMPLEGARADALARFFVAAAAHVESYDVVDPAGVCGPIQPDLDKPVLARSLRTAGDLAWEAVTADADGDTPTALGIWSDVLGEGFPNPGADTGPKTPVAGLFGGAAPTLIRPRPVKDAPQG